MKTSVKKVADAKLPTEFGVFHMFVFKNNIDSKEHIVLVKGNLKNTKTPLVRVHSECLTGEVFGSLRCECGPQLHEALKKINKKGVGVLVYLRQEGRGIGLVNKIKAYKWQDTGLDTIAANKKLGFKADLREYDIAGEILTFLGVKQIQLLTNNPDKLSSLEKYGLRIVKRVSLEIKPNRVNRKYLMTKKNILKHMLKHV